MSRACVRVLCIMEHPLPIGRPFSKDIVYRLAAMHFITLNAFISVTML